MCTKLFNFFFLSYTTLLYRQFTKKRFSSQSIEENNSRRFFDKRDTPRVWRTLLASCLPFINKLSLRRDIEKLRLENLKVIYLAYTFKLKINKQPI